MANEVESNLVLCSGQGCGHFHVGSEMRPRSGWRHSSQLGRLRVTIATRGWHHELVCRSVVFVTWKVELADFLQCSWRKLKSSLLFSSSNSSTPISLTPWHSSCPASPTPPPGTPRTHPCGSIQRREDCGLLAIEPFDRRHNTFRKSTIANGPSCVARNHQWIFFS